MKQANKQQQQGKQSSTEQTKPNTGSDESQNKKNRLALFDHLPRRQVPAHSETLEGERLIHSATLKLAGLFYNGSIHDDDDRVSALIVVFCKIIQDYKTPPKKSLREDLDKYISKQVQFLVDSRPLSKGMGNLIKYLRHCISKIKIELNESEAKAVILEQLKSFIEERIQFAGDSIAKCVSSIIRDKDVLLTFGSSPLLRKIIAHAAKTKSFQLVVVDTRPLQDGLLTIASLPENVRCIYVPLSGASHAMKTVTRVILGASSLMSNGAMLAPAGSAMIASLAKANQIPVIVTAESYKFTEKVQLDSIVFNELGSASEVAVLSPAGPNGEVVAVPQEVRGYRGGMEKIATGLIDSSSSSGHSDFFNASVIAIPVPLHSSAEPNGHRTGPKPVDRLPFEVVNLRYDLTPVGNISVVATETGLIPPTSIPVLIRELMTEQNFLGDN